MDVRFIKTSRALAHLAGGHADQSRRKRLSELTKPALLILDDWGMRELTAAQADDLYELVSERSGKSMPHLQPGPGGVIQAVSQPGGRRVPPGPADQHQLPDLHGRPELPPQQTSWPETRGEPDQEPFLRHSPALPRRTVPLHLSVHSASPCSRGSERFGTESGVSGVLPGQ
ncbi:ATP-binding protein [Nonomuraea fuscirosea]|uniref:ATP-binding protein n=1 Tax=Nonomuraea fuscirosea TaxID=1291556 RepID=UPI003419CF83